MFSGLSMACVIFQPLQVNKPPCLSFLFWQVMNSTPTEMKKAQVIHKCGDDESERLFTCHKNVLFGVGQSVGLSCVSNGVGVGVRQRCIWDPVSYRCCKRWLGAPFLCGICW